MQIAFPHIDQRGHDIAPRQFEVPYFHLDRELKRRIARGGDGEGAAVHSAGGAGGDEHLQPQRRERVAGKVEGVAGDQFIRNPFQRIHERTRFGQLRIFDPAHLEPERHGLAVLSGQRSGNFDRDAGKVVSPIRQKQQLAVFPLVGGGGEFHGSADFTGEEVVRQQTVQRRNSGDRERQQRRLFAEPGGHRVAPRLLQLRIRPESGGVQPLLTLDFFHFRESVLRNRQYLEIVQQPPEEAGGFPPGFIKPAADPPRHAGKAQFAGGLVRIGAAGRPAVEISRHPRLVVNQREVMPFAGFQPPRVGAAVVELAAVGGVRFKPVETGAAVEHHVPARRPHDRKFRAARFRPDPERERHLPARPVFIIQREFQKILFPVETQRVAGDSRAFRDSGGAGQHRPAVVAAQRLFPVEAPLHARRGKRGRQQNEVSDLCPDRHLYCPSRLQNKEKSTFILSALVSPGLNSERE